ncbi:MAG: response regulator [Butyribacter sp.]|nr:response regulator [bacterium]MDY3854702.1 response regulator [Butyribacter sp.]
MENTYRYKVKVEKNRKTGKSKKDAVKKKKTGNTDTRDHILVADDDMVFWEIIRNMLEPQFRVSFVKSGTEVISFLQKEIPSLILLDLNMPDKSGLEVLQEIMAHRKWRDIPVLFITAENDSEMESKGFEAGALDFIIKPLDKNTLVQRVRRNIKIHQVQQKLQADLKEQTRKAKERQMQVERLSMQIMEALADTIDAKDEYTNGHSIRVAEYSREIARRLDMSPKKQKDFYYMGLLHDIGKIGIPDEIISKKAQLSDEEYKIIKSHPVIGGDILKNISEIPGIETGARWHHEKYDGTGYPDGLKGEEIPLAARVIGVADAYDAMASKRSYRDVLPQKVVREEIAKGSGTQFDPVIVEKMLEMIDEDKEYRLREMDV